MTQTVFNFANLVCVLVFASEDDFSVGFLRLSDNSGDYQRGGSERVLMMWEFVNVAEKNLYVALAFERASAEMQARVM